MTGQGGWQPIETMPHGKLVLLCGFTGLFDDDRAAPGNWRIGVGCLAKNCTLEGGPDPLIWDMKVVEADDPQPTHWQPLPEPPK